MKRQHQKTIRALLASVREYKKPSLWCPVFVVLEVLMEVLVPGVMALIIDKGISFLSSSKPTPTLRLYSGAMMCLTG